mgnify:CR=1 FL=1
MKITKCRICQSANLSKLFSLGNLAFTGKFPKKKQIIKKKPIEVVICRKCELVQLRHNFDLKYLYGPDYGYKTGINKTMLNHVKKVVNTLSNKTKLKIKDSVLDIASNDGSLLKYYKRGVKTFGIDPILKKYKKEYRKVNYYISDFFSANKIKKKYKNKFKIITALSVFYDAKDPNKFLQDVKSLLIDDGVFMLEFADLYSIIKYKMFDTICHEHLEYYSSKVIIELAKVNNLRVFDIKENDINGGSKQYYICHNNSNYKNNQKIIDKFLNLEKKLKLSEPKTFKKFFKNIQNLKHKLTTLIKKLKKQDKTLHCYGASTKGNVLLQYFNIDNKLIEFAAERNQKKFNLFTPGTKIKIISEKKSRSYNPDFYLVLPWHFRKEILKREKFIRTKGTKFIFPLPTVYTV